MKWLWIMIVTACGGGSSSEPDASAPDADVAPDAMPDAMQPVCVSGTTIEGNLEILNQLDAQQLAGVERITGTLLIDAPGLTSVDVSALREVGGFLDIRAQAFTTLELPCLETVGQSLSLSAHDMTLFRAPKLDAIRNVSANAGTSTSTTTRVELPLLASAEGLSIGNIGTVELPALTTVSGDVRFSNSTAPAIRLPSLVSVRLLVLSMNAATEFDFAELATIVLDAEITFNGALATLGGFPKLATVHTLQIERNATLGTLDFPALTSLNDLAVRSNSMLPTCEATELAIQTNPVSVDISGNNDNGTCP